MLHGLESSGQHCYAGEHDIGFFHLEARLFQGALNVVRRETHCIRVVQHASEEIPGGKGRVLTSVVDHEIVHKDQAIRRKCIKGTTGKDSDVVFSDRAPNIGHENYIVILLATPL